MLQEQRILRGTLSNCVPKSVTNQPQDVEPNPATSRDRLHARSGRRLRARGTRHQLGGEQLFELLPQ